MVHPVKSPGLNPLMLFLLFFAFSLSAQAQTVQIEQALSHADALFAKDPAAAINEAKRAENMARQQHLPVQQVKSLNLLAYFAYGSKQLSQGQIYAGQAFQAAQKAGIDSLAGDALVTLGIIQSGNLQFDAAIITYQKALHYYSKDHMTLRLGAVYLNLGMCERKLGRFGQANSYYFKAAEIFHQAKDNASLAEVYNSVANCFSSLGNYQKSISYHRNSLSIRKKLQDTSAVAQSCNNLGYVFKLNHQPDSALIYLTRALRLRENKGDSSRLTLTLQNIGSAWKMKGNLPLAEKFIVRSLKIAAIYHMEEDVARGNIDLSELMLARNMPDSAISRINQAQRSVTGLHFPELQLNIYEVKQRAYAAKSNWKQAFHYGESKERLKDSLFTVSKDKTINELEVRYQTRQHQKDITALTLQNKLEHRVVNQQRLLILFLVISGVLLLFLLGAVYSNYKAKNLNNKRIQTLMQELHHRVKNNLQILSGLFMMQIESLDDEAAKNALRENESRLTSMNLIHHKLYRDQGTTTIEMPAYLHSLCQHIQSSFGEQHTQVLLQMDIDPVILHADKAVAVGLIVNELLTNSFKYAFPDHTGYIKLNLKKTGNHLLLLTLEDSGPGRDGADQTSGESFGLKIVRIMARQLDAELETDPQKTTHYRMSIKI